MEHTTREWRVLAISISEYIINSQNIKNLSVIELYNQWANQSNIIIQNDKLFNWALNYIADIKEIDTAILREAFRLDTQNEQTLSKQP